MLGRVGPAFRLGGKGELALVVVVAGKLAPECES